MANLGELNLAGFPHHTFEVFGSPVKNKRIVAALLRKWIITTFGVTKSRFATHMFKGSMQGVHCSSIKETTAL
jgi:hypothetical protein